jgi:hypothetical protein
MALLDFLNKKSMENNDIDDTVDNVSIAENIIKIMTEMGFSVGSNS